MKSINKLELIAIVSVYIKEDTSPQKCKAIILKHSPTTLLIKAALLGAFILFLIATAQPIMMQQVPL